MCYQCEYTKKFLEGEADMKKKLFTLILSAMCVAGLVVSANAGEPTYKENRQIPRAATAPVIDGVITDDEWDNALTININSDNTEEIFGDGYGTSCPESVFRFMWSPDGLYFFGEVADTTDPAVKHAENHGHYNSGDGLQLCIYPNVNDTDAIHGKLYFWTMVVAGSGKAEVGEHYVYGSGAEIGVDVDAVEAAAVKDGTAYTYEAFFPAFLFTATDTPLMFKDGITFAMTNCVLEAEGFTQYLYSDSAWFDATWMNKYTFVNTKAGHIGADTPDDPETEEPDTDAPVKPNDPVESDKPAVDMTEWFATVQYIHNKTYSVKAIASEGGKVEASAPTAKYGTNVSVSITPDEGFAIADVLVDNKSVGVTDVVKFDRINRHHVVTAIFEAIEAEVVETEAPETEEPAALPFEDVAADAWYYNDVAYVYANGLMNGTSDTTFEAEAELTRAMLVTTLWRLEGEPEADAAAFTDVAADQWYTAAINWAAANGIVNGYEDGTFAPDKAITREEAIAVLARYAALKGVDTADVADAVEATYSEWAADAALWAEKAGLLAGIADFADLTAGANRAEIAALLTRLAAVLA